MDRVNLILKNPKYQEYIDRINRAEESRIFCLHNMNHFLDVARIAHIMNLEEGLGLSRELIYATALLHDIGRFLQYEEGISHETASVSLAPEILRETGFSEEEIGEILSAVREHRNSQIAEEKSLAGIIYLADKTSRACFSCKAEKSCNWSVQKKNLTIVR